MTFIWTHLETAGNRGPTLGHILEVGFYLTESNDPYTFLGSVGYVVRPHIPLEALIEEMDPPVLKRITKSGLLELLKHPGIPQSLWDAEQECIELIGRFVQPGEGIMAGRAYGMDSASSFGYPRREWIKILMPDLWKMFHPDKAQGIVPRKSLSLGRSTTLAEEAYHDFIDFTIKE